MQIDTWCAIDQPSYAGETALSFAALSGRLDMLPVLVAHGANPNHADARGTTAQRMAIEQGNLSARRTHCAVSARPNEARTRNCD
jgi:uncharacterized protein